MATKTIYQVQHMPEWHTWKLFHATDIEIVADTVAGWRATYYPHIPVRIIETTLDDGMRIGKPKEYIINPPHCSNMGLPERGIEKCFRGHLDVDDITAFLSKPTNNYYET